MNYILETERLRLRQFSLGDTKFIIELVNTAGWIENIGDRNIKTEEQAREYLQNGPLKSYEVNGFGLSLVELKDGNIAIGMCGIIRRDNLLDPDIGFAFLPEFTGQGFAFEIAEATMNYARITLQLPTILAICIPSNKPSIRLLEKLGLKFIRKFNFPNDQEELMLFST